MEFAILIFFFLIIVPSAVIHEYFHGWTANFFGDPTAKYAGRLTLNPLAHIDSFGTIFMPILLFLLSGGTFIFAYAKPVPINPLNLRGKYSVPLVALAGPLANFLTAFVVAMLIRLLPVSQFALILSLIVYANILLAVFNLIPIPPLDGSKILLRLIPRQWFGLRLFLEQYGFFLLLLFLLVGFRWIIPIILAIFQLFTGRPLMF